MQNTSASQPSPTTSKPTTRISKMQLFSWLAQVSMIFLYLVFSVGAVSLVFYACSVTTLPHEHLGPRRQPQKNLRDWIKESTEQLLQAKQQNHRIQRSARKFPRQTQASALSRWLQAKDPDHNLSQALFQVHRQACLTCIYRPVSAGGIQRWKRAF